MNINDIIPNKDNPRVIRDDNFKKLVKSIRDFPEMLEIRPIVLNKEHVILGGNMRYRACKEAGLKDIPVQIVDLPEDKQREFIIKDNVSGGDWDWDILANEWDISAIEQWGLELPKSWGEYTDEFSLANDDRVPFGQMTFMLADKQIEVVKEALSKIDSNAGETYGNENGNGNKLYWIVEQWLEL